MMDSTDQSTPRMPGYALLGLGTGAAALFNFISLPMARSTDGDPGGIVVFGGMIVGVFAAELGLATLWLVFGTGAFWRRLGLHWAAGFGLFAAWALGFAAAVGQHGPPGGVGEVWGIVLCGLPLVALAAQLPLWVMRIYSGWRIEPPAGSAPAEVPQPLMIRDLLAGMAVTGVSLAALRLMPEELHRDSDFWMAWGIAVVSIAGASALTLLPAIIMVLRIREATLAGLSWFFYSGASLIVTLVVVSIVAGSGPPGEAVVAGLIAVYTFASAIAVPLFAIRSHGYRLWYAGERPAAAASPAPETNS